ncbi:MAG: V-type ATP synthase subunit A, partial [Firmicutes bacterium]|nr:V-type ATP synthase subunit A [Bacillota bacterium]
MGKIVKVSGPLIVAEGMANSKMFDVVRVSNEKLVGEILEIRGDRASIQVYEETTGIGIGEPVETTGLPLAVELAPGIMAGIYDGIGRPLETIRQLYGDRIARGIEVSGIDRKTKWEFEPKVKVGDEVVAGDIVGVVQENEVVEHRIMVPVGISGKISKINKGKFTIEETVC